MATKIATKMAVNSKSISDEQFIHLQGSDRTSGAVQPKNKIDADLRHNHGFCYLFMPLPRI